jgi:hypothetical protein
MGHVLAYLRASRLASGASLQANGMHATRELTVVITVRAGSTVQVLVKVDHFVRDSGKNFLCRTVGKGRGV